MRVDRTVLSAMIGAGALWILGICVVTLMSSLVVIAGACAYVLIFALAIASRRLPTRPVLFAGWAAAVAAACLLMQQVDGDVGTVVLLGGVLGSFLFASWTVPSFFLLLLIEPDLRRVTE